MTKLRAISGALFLFGIAGGMGLFLLKHAFKIDEKSKWLLPFSWALGFGALAIAVIFFGWLPVGTLDQKLLWLEIGCVPFFVYGLRENLKFVKGKNLFTGTLPPSSALCFALALAGAAICLITAFSPITYYDSLVYHLGLPAHYLVEGRITPAVFNLYSFFPENTEMLYLFILARLPEPEYVINLMLWGFSFLISVAIFQWAKEKWNSKTAWLGVFLWWTMPAVLFLSVGGYVEIPLALYTFFSLIAFNLSREQKNVRWLVLSGFFSGFACATKYTGAITPMFITLLLAWERRPKAIFLFCAAVLIPMLPWFVRNMVAVGNPFFPFFYKSLGSGNIGWTNESAGAYFQMLTEYGAKSSLFFELLSAPINMIRNTAKFGGGFDVLGDFGWTLLIIMAPLGFFAAWERKPTRWLVVYCLFHFCFWFLTKPVLRFLVGALPLFTLIAAAALKKLFFDKKSVVPFLSAFVVAFFIFSNFFMYFFISGVLKPFQVPLGGIDRETYLEKRLSFYAAFEYLNTAQDKNLRIFMLGEQRTYHLRVPHISASIFAPSPLARLCETGNAQILRDEFEHQKITHVLVHTKEIQRLGGLEKFGFSEHQKEVLYGFLSQNCRLVFNRNSVLIYETPHLKPN